MRFLISRKSIVFLLVSVSVVLLVSMVFKNYIANNNRIESARRIICGSNLIQIANRLTQENVKLRKENISKIKNILEELSLSCPSGNVVHVQKNLAQYEVLVLPSGDVVVTEHQDNHDTTKMRFINKPYVRLCLYQKQNDPNSLHLGEWKNKTMAIGAIGKHNATITNIKYE